MSGERNDGGPAFPMPIDARSRDFSPTEPGMTLRDWIAGREDVSGWEMPNLHGAAEILGVEKPDSSLSPASYNLDLDIRLRAALRYRIADAMIAARNRP